MVDDCRTWPPTLVSVVVPAHNVEGLLPDQLRALSRQTYQGQFEVVVVDNASTDGTAAVAMAHAASIPLLRVHPAFEERGVSHARNEGVAATSGSLVAFCDADDRVEEGWLAALVTAAEGADVVAGYLESSALNAPLAAAWRGELPRDRALTAIDWWPFAPGGNCAIWRDVIAALGGWSSDFVGGSDDVDFCWRAQLAGYRLVFAPDAVMSYRFRDGIRSLWRQFFTYGRTEALLVTRYREHGLPVPSRAQVAHRWLRLVKRCPDLVDGPVARGLWVRDVAYTLGRLRGGMDCGFLFS